MSSQDPFASLYAADAIPTIYGNGRSPIIPNGNTQSIPGSQLNQLYQQLTGSAPTNPLGGSGGNTNLAAGSTAGLTNNSFTPGMTPNLSNFFSSPLVSNPGFAPVQFGSGAMFDTPPTPFNPGSVSIGSALVNLANQSQIEAMAGQGAMNNILAPMQGFNSTLGAFAGNAMGETQSLMNQLPASMNWAGQAATGDLNTQNALVQQLLGQTLGGINGMQGQTNGTLQSLMQAGQNTSGVLGSGPGLTTNAQNMLNATGAQLENPLAALLGQANTPNNGMSSTAMNFMNGGLNGAQPTLSAAQNLFGTGLNPATSAAMNTQAMDQTAQQYNNARQSVMTQLLNQGAMGGGATNAGGSSQQQLTDLGNLSTAQQQQQSNLMQNAILANQQQMNQNNQLGLGAAQFGGSLGAQLGGLAQSGFQNSLGVGLGALNAGTNLATNFTNLQQQAAETQAQQALGAASTLGNLGLGSSQLTGGLASSLGNLYNSGALGFGGLTNQYYNTAQNYPLPYVNSTQTGLENLLGGAEQFGQLGIQGVAAADPLMSSAVSLTAPGATQSLIGAGIGALGSILGDILPTI